MSITNVAYPAISISLIYVTASSNSGRSVLNAARWPPSSCTLPLQPKHTHMLVITRSGHICGLKSDFSVLVALPNLHKGSNTKYMQCQT